MDEKYLSENPAKYVETYEDGNKIGINAEAKVDIEKINGRLSALWYL